MYNFSFYLLIVFAVAFSTDVKNADNTDINFAKINSHLRGNPNKCSSNYFKAIVKYMSKHSSNNTVVIKNMIEKISNSSGQTQEFIQNCLGI
jgi:hypothetical protein